VSRRVVLGLRRRDLGRRPTEDSIDRHIDSRALIHDWAIIDTADIMAGVSAVNDGAVAGGHHANVSGRKRGDDDWARGDDDGPWSDGHAAAGDGGALWAGDGHTAAGDGDGAIRTDDGGPARTGHAIGGAGFGGGAGQQEQGDRDDCGW
jgi:hypothetical protein